MSKFWYGVGSVLIIAIFLLTVTAQPDNIHFTDLETECQLDREEYVKVDLRDDNSLGFKGKFLVPDTQSDVNYEYTERGDQISLNIVTSGGEEIEDFTDRCGGMAVYKAGNQPLSQGIYDVKVFHDGERVYHSKIRVR